MAAARIIDADDEELVGVEWSARADDVVPPPDIVRVIGIVPRDMMVTGLNAIPGITCRKPGGAFYLFPNIGGLCQTLGAITAHRKMVGRDRTSPATLVQMFLLWRHRVATMDRRSFGRIGSEGQHYLRISIATALDDLKLALDRLRAASNDVEGFHSFMKEGAHLC